MDRGPPFLHVLDPNSFSFYVKCPRKCQKTYNFDHPPMCILLKLHYAKFDVSRLFCSKVIEEKSLGGLIDPPPPPLFGKGRVKIFSKNPNPPVQIRLNASVLNSMNKTPCSNIWVDL